MGMISIPKIGTSKFIPDIWSKKLVEKWLTGLKTPYSEPAWMSEDYAEDYLQGGKRVNVLAGPISTPRRSKIVRVFAHPTMNLADRVIIRTLPMLEPPKFCFEEGKI